MTQIFSLLYLIFFLGVSIAAMFVVYHISRYSLSKTNAFWGNTIFLGVLAILLIINANLFFDIDWTSIASVTPIPYTPTW